MWTTVIAFLVQKALPAIWHAVCRFWSVFLIATVLASCWFWWKGHEAGVYNNGYKSGYSQCMKGHPTQQGHIVNITNPKFKAFGIEIDIWKLGLRLGI